MHQASTGLPSLHACSLHADFKSTNAVQLLQTAHERYERCKVRYTSACEFGTTYAMRSIYNPIRAWKVLSCNAFIMLSLLTVFLCVCRGRFRSKPWQQLLDEAKYLVESGVKELNLIAEDTNQYGQDRKDGKGLAQLMHELGKLEGLQWMRILYAYPSYFTEDLIDEIATNPKVERWTGQITASHADFTIPLSSC